MPDVNPARTQARQIHETLDSLESILKVIDANFRVGTDAVSVAMPGEQINALKTQYTDLVHQLQRLAAAYPDASIFGR